MESSPWRQPYLADLTFGEIYRLVNTFVHGRGLAVLDVGCGSGFLSLELAREGHDVLGIDENQESAKRARRTMRTDPYKAQRGRLRYEVSEFSSWKSRGRMFDVVIFSRVLHHIPRPGKVLEEVQDLLSSRGRIICVEYAYDRFDRRSATWFYHVRRICEQAGWYASKKRLTDNSPASIDRIMKDWQEHGMKERLNLFTDMYNPLRRLFEEVHFSWEPYVFWDILSDLRIPSVETETLVSRSLREMEKTLINKNAMSPILFCFVGEPLKVVNILVGDEAGREQDHVL